MRDRKFAALGMRVPRKAKRFKGKRELKNIHGHASGCSGIAPVEQLGVGVAVSP